MTRSTPRLFDDWPPGFRYEGDFLTASEEETLALAIERVEFSTFEMRGVVARRRVAFYGRTYDSSLTASPSIPAFLLPLREKVGRWSGIDPAAFAMALINQYPPGAPIGWHRDAPQYGSVAGVSLLSPCRMKFRPYAAPGGTAAGRPRRSTHEVRLEPRSAYLLSGLSRTDYEHHIPAVDRLRYSITFRTLRR
jgi:alkylated DNA repair dioxygenase AlkB